MFVDDNAQDIETLHIHFFLSYRYLFFQLEIYC